MAVCPLSRLREWSDRDRISDEPQLQSNDKLTIVMLIGQVLIHGSVYEAVCSSCHCYPWGWGEGGAKRIFKAAAAEALAEGGLRRVTLRPAGVCEASAALLLQGRSFLLKIDATVAIKTSLLSLINEIFPMLRSCRLTRT